MLCMFWGLSAWRQNDVFWRQKFRNMNLKSNIRRFETCPESGQPGCPQTCSIRQVFFRVSTCFLKKGAIGVPSGNTYGTFFQKTERNSKKDPANHVGFGASRRTTFGSHEVTAYVGVRYVSLRVFTINRVYLTSENRPDSGLPTCSKTWSVRRWIY